MSKIEIDLSEAVEKESIMDRPQQDLNPMVWSKREDGTYCLTEEAKSKLTGIFSWAVERYNLASCTANVVGSITSNQYSEDSDIDLHIFSPKIKEDQQEDFNSKVREEFKQIFGGKPQGMVGNIPIEIYFQTNPYQDMTSVGCYDLIGEKWVVGPEIKDMNYDPYGDFYDDDMKMNGGNLDSIRDLILKIHETGVAVDKTNDAELKQRLADQLYKLIKDGKDLYDKIRDDRKQAENPENAQDALEMRNDREWKVSDSAFKMLDHFGYMQILHRIGDFFWKMDENPNNIVEVVEFAKNIFSQDATSWDCDGNNSEPDVSSVDKIEDVKPVEEVPELENQPEDETSGEVDEDCQDSYGIFESIKDFFGTTDSIEEAQWVLPDGSFISMNGRDGFGNGKTANHGDIGCLIGQNINESVEKFMDLGCVLVDGKNLMISKKMTDEQIESISESIQNHYRQFGCSDKFIVFGSDGKNVFQTPMVVEDITTNNKTVVSSTKEDSEEHNDKDDDGENEDVDGPENIDFGNVLIVGDKLPDGVREVVNVVNQQDSKRQEELEESEIFAFMRESGNTFKDAKRIKKNDIFSTIKDFKEKVIAKAFPGIDISENSEVVKLVGSTGSKDESGDIDVALQASATNTRNFEDFALVVQGVFERINDEFPIFKDLTDKSKLIHPIKRFNCVCTIWPCIDSVSKKQKTAIVKMEDGTEKEMGVYVQVDMMYGQDMNHVVWAEHTPDKNAEGKQWKGGLRGILLTRSAQAVENRMLGNSPEDVEILKNYGVQDDRTKDETTYGQDRYRICSSWDAMEGFKTEIKDYLCIAKGKNYRQKMNTTGRQTGYIESTNNVDEIIKLVFGENAKIDSTYSIEGILELIKQKYSSDQEKMDQIIGSSIKDAITQMGVDYKNKGWTEWSYPSSMNDMVKNEKTRKEIASYAKLNVVDNPKSNYGAPETQIYGFEEIYDQYRDEVTSTIAYVPGSFKPCTRWHFEMFKFYLEKVGENGKVVICVSDPKSEKAKRKTSLGNYITGENSKKIIQIVLDNLLPNQRDKFNVVVSPSGAPIRDIEDEEFMNSLGIHNCNMILGVGSKDSADRFQSISKNALTNLKVNIQDPETTIFTSQDSETGSASQARANVENDDELRKILPDGLNDEAFQEIKKLMTQSNSEDSDIEGEGVSTKITEKLKEFLINCHFYNEDGVPADKRATIQFQGNIPNRGIYNLKWWKKVLPSDVGQQDDMKNLFPDIDFESILKNVLKDIKKASSEDEIQNDFETLKNGGTFGQKEYVASTNTKNWYLGAEDKNRGGKLISWSFARAFYNFLKPNRDIEDDLKNGQTNWLDNRDKNAAGFEYGNEKFTQKLKEFILKSQFAVGNDKTGYKAPNKQTMHFHTLRNEKKLKFTTVVPCPEDDTINNIDDGKFIQAIENVLKEFNLQDESIKAIVDYIKKGSFCEADKIFNGVTKKSYFEKNENPICISFGKAFLDYMGVDIFSDKLNTTKKIEDISADEIEDRKVLSNSNTDAEIRVANDIDEWFKKQNVPEGEKFSATHSEGAKSGGSQTADVLVSHIKGDQTRQFYVEVKNGEDFRTMNPRIYMDLENGEFQFKYIETAEKDPSGNLGEAGRKIGTVISEAMSKFCNGYIHAIQNIGKIYEKYLEMKKENVSEGLDKQGMDYVKNMFATIPTLYDMIFGENKNQDFIDMVEKEGIKLDIKSHVPYNQIEYVRDNFGQDQVKTLEFIYYVGGEPAPGSIILGNFHGKQSNYEYEDEDEVLEQLKQIIVEWYRDRKNSAYLTVVQRGNSSYCGTYLLDKDNDPLGILKETDMYNVSLKDAINGVKLQLIKEESNKDKPMEYKVWMGIDINFNSLQMRELLQNKTLENLDRSRDKYDFFMSGNVENV